jgi:DNA polymerase (family X)
MPVHNADIAGAFGEIADLLEIGDANPFRVRAYRNAARVIGELQLDVAAVIRRGETLPKLPGIGEDLSGKIHEIVATGHCSLLERLRKSVPPAVTDLLTIPGLGPKRFKVLYHDLDVQTLEQRLRAASRRANPLVDPRHEFGHHELHRTIVAVRSSLPLPRCGRR